MATSNPPTTATSGQAMAVTKNMTPLYVVLAVLIVLLIAGAVAGYLESRRTETVYLVVKPLVAGQPIPDEAVGAIDMPLHRPEQLAGMTDKAQIVGKYATRSLGVNDLFQPAMLAATPPDQPTFATGKQLHKDMVTAPFQVAYLGPSEVSVLPLHYLNIGFNDTSGDPTMCQKVQGAAAAPSASAAKVALGAPGANGAQRLGAPYACRFMTRITVLEVAGDTAYLEVSPAQSLVLQVMTTAGYPLWPEISGFSSEALPPLERLDITQFTPNMLVAPTIAPTAAPGTAPAAAPAAAPATQAQPTAAPATQPTAGGAVPGGNVAVPGSNAAPTAQAQPTVAPTATT